MIFSSGNVKMAIEAIRSARWRSLLTILGIVIGVVSVVTIVSLGEGTKRQIVGQINQSGPDLITIRPGNTIKLDENGEVSGVSLVGALNVGSFSETDFKTVQSVPELRDVTPFSYVTSQVSTDEVTYDSGIVVGTNQYLPDVLGQKIEYGVFFTEDELNRKVAVIGKRVAEQLFKENVPIGKVFNIRGQEFVVRGVFEEFKTSPLSPNNDYNAAIFIPKEVGSQLTDADGKMYQILARPNDPSRLDTAITAVTEALQQAHAGQQDFTVLRQEDNLIIASSILNILTTFVSGVAAISLLVGGIGILNIMLVSVTERTHEIGIRKAIGATNRQILGQFLTESIILSLLGGFLGVILSLLTNYLFRIFTDLTPVISLPIIIIAVGVAVMVGVIFGITPALKAARKHPIDALRHV